MKKLLVLFSVLVLLAFTGCFDSKDSTELNPEQQVRLDVLKSLISDANAGTRAIAGTGFVLDGLYKDNSVTVDFYSFAYLGTVTDATLIALLNNGVDPSLVIGTYTIKFANYVSTQDYTQGILVTDAAALVKATDLVNDMANSGTVMKADGTASVLLVTTISVSAITIQELQTATAVIKVLDQNGTEMTGETLTYEVDDTNVATVAAGVVTAKAYVSGSNTATLTVTYTSGSAIVTGAAIVTVTEDAVLPTATLEVIDSKHIEVMFSETVTGLDTLNTDNYSLVKVSDAATELLDGAGATVVVLEAGIKVKLRLEDTVDLLPADYILKVNPTTAGNIADEAGNEVYEGTEISFTAQASQLTDVTAPVLQTAAYDSSTKQLVLTFDENLDGTSYDATKVTFAGATLVVGDTGAIVTNVLTITVSTATAGTLDLTGTVNVVLADAVTDAALNGVAVTKEVTLVTPPELADATATGSSFDEASRVLTIVFNEAVTIDDMTKVFLDNNADTAQAFNATNDTVLSGNGTTTILIQLSTTTYDLIKDNAGTTIGLELGVSAVKDVEATANKAVGTAIEIPYTQDATAPTISGVTYNNQTNILTITLNEALVSDVDAEWSIDSDPTTGAITLAAATGGANGVVPAIANTNTIVATFDDTDSATVEAWFTAGKTVKVFTTAATAVTDLAANNVGVIALADGTAVTLEDQIAPEVSSTAIATLSSTKFAIEFNEVMDETAAEIASNYVIYDNQNDVNISVTSAELLADNVTVYLKSSVALDVFNVNNYTITVNNVKDVNLNRIANNSTKAFTLGAVDSVAPAVNTVVLTAIANGLNDTIAINYTEAGTGVNEVTSTTLSNYTLRNSSEVVIALTGSDIVLAGTTVTITLTNGVNLVTGDDYTLDIVNITDNAENTMTDFEGTAETVVGDSGVPTISSVVGSTTLAGDQIVVTLSEAVTEVSAEALANWTVMNDTAGTPADITSIATSLTYTETDADSDGTLDTFTATFLFTGNTLTGAISVDSKDATYAAIDLAGNKIAVGDAPVADAAIADGVPPTISSGVATSIAGKMNDTIVVTFSESVIAATVTDESNWTIKDSAGTTIDALQYVIAATSGTVATVTFDAITNLQTGDSYSVEIDGILDDAGNNLVGTVSDVVEGDATASAAFTAVATAGAATVVVTMDEVIDATTITKADFTVLHDVDADFTTLGDQTTLIITTMAIADDVVTLTLSAVLPGAGTEAVRVTLAANSGLKDLAGNETTASLTDDDVID